MGARVRDFCIAHPSDAGNVKDAVARLDELLRKAESLGMAQRSGRLEELSAANRRNALRRSAKFELLHHLVTIGRLAGEEVPSLAGKFYLRSPDATHTSFLASTKLMLRLAEENKELLMRKGLSEDLLTELSAAVACASLSNRRSIVWVSTSEPAPSNSGRTSLTAAGRASSRCFATHTSPMPPRPSSSTS